MEQRGVALSVAAQVVHYWSTCGHNLDPARDVIGRMTAGDPRIDQKTLERSHGKRRRLAPSQDV